MKTNQSWIRLIVILLLIPILSENTQSQTVTMSILGGNPDNCANPLPNAGTYTASGTINGKNAYYKGTNLQMFWDGSKWVLQAKDNTISGASFITCWENAKNTPTPPEGCWTATFGCFLIGMSGADAYPTVALSSSSRGSTNPTGIGTNIDYIFTFSGTINSLTSSNFSLSSTGTISGASITGVSQTSASVWKVTVNTGSGTGTVSVDMVNYSGASAIICSMPVYGSTYTVTSSTCTAPTVPTVTGGSMCLSGSVNLGISGTLNDAASWYIYSGSCGGTLVGTTSTGSYSVSPSSTTTYYIRGEGNCVTPGSCGSATVTVNTNSAISSVSSSASPVCPGTQVTLTPNGVTTGTGATLTWFTGAGGTGTNLGTTNPLDHTPTGATTYYARLAGTCNTVEASTTVTLNTLSAISSVSSSASPVCPGTQVTLTPNGVTTGTGATLTWFTGTSGTGTNLGTTNPLDHTPSETTTYYARLDGTCNTVEASTTVTLNTLSAITSVTASAAAICLGNADTMTANGVTTGTGATLTWYTATGGGGTNLGTNNPLYHTPTGNTTYYARLAGTCNTVEANTSVSINALPVISSITSSRNPTTNGYAPYQCADLTATATGAGSLNYDWSNAATGSVINVCPTSGTTYTVLVTDVNGCMISDTFRQSVMEATSPYSGRIIMCYTYPRRAPMNINVYPRQVQQYLNAGASLGACGATPSKRNFDAFYDDIYRIYPNPAQNHITVEWFGLFNEMVTIELVDMTGRVVKNIFNGEVLEGNISLTTTDVSSLPTGMYFMRYTSPSDVRINKVQLMR